jgi:hypothetical protein
MPTATSSLGFTCHCRPNYVWGNFASLTEAQICENICAIAEQRRVAACATAAASGGTYDPIVCK